MVNENSQRGRKPVINYCSIICVISHGKGSLEA